MMSFALLVMLFGAENVVRMLLDEGVNVDKIAEDVVLQKENSAFSMPRS